MEAEQKFIAISALICEPKRAQMLWSLLDGRAYTAGELAMVANISATSASNHLSRLLEANMVKVEIQGRHRYFSLFSYEVAYVVEALANLAGAEASVKSGRQIPASGVKYCRTCYDHLAGYLGVAIAEGMERKGYLKKIKNIYLVTKNGWNFLSQFNICPDKFKNSRRPLTRQCLDWSERRSHLAGQLGAALLSKMIDEKWFRKLRFSRELIVTPLGRQKLTERFSISV